MATRLQNRFRSKFLPMPAFRRWTLTPEGRHPASHHVHRPLRRFPSSVGWFRSGQQGFFYCQRSPQESVHRCGYCALRPNPASGVPVETPLPGLERRDRFRPISTPTRRVRSGCCALAASGQTAPDPAQNVPGGHTTRRICLPIIGEPVSTDNK